MAKIIKTNQLPIITDLTNANVIGLDKDGKDAQFPLANIVRSEKGIAFPATVPTGNRFPGETWMVDTNSYGSVFTGFGGQTVPVEVGGIKILNARFVWNNGAWSLQKDLLSSSGLVTRTEYNQLSDTVTGLNTVAQAISKEELQSKWLSPGGWASNASTPGSAVSTARNSELIPVFPGETIYLYDIPNTKAGVSAGGVVNPLALYDSTGVRIVLVSVAELTPLANKANSFLYKIPYPTTTVLNPVVAVGVNIDVLDKATAKIQKNDNRLTSAVVDPRGYVVSATTKLGETYPGIRPEPERWINEDLFFSYLQSDTIVDNAVQQQWIEPMAVYDGDSIFFTSISSVVKDKIKNSAIWLNVKKGNGPIKRKMLFMYDPAYTVPSEDHVGASVYLNKDQSKYPLLIAQVGHNKGSVKLFQQSSLHIERMTDKYFLPLKDRLENSYTQICTPLPGQILIMTRTRPTGNTSQWKFLYSEDGGATWFSRLMFNSGISAYDDLYLTMREKEDRSGLNIAFNNHPIAVPEANQIVGFMELDYTTGAIVNPSNRNSPIIADFRQAVKNPNFVAINPFSLGRILYQPGVGESVRLWSITRSVTGECVVLITTFPYRATTPAQFNQSKYKVISFNLSDGSINYTKDMGEGGGDTVWPMGGNMYNGGGDLLNNNQLVKSVYKNQAQINGAATATVDTGKSWVYLTDFTNENAPVDTLIKTENRKLARPYLVVGTKDKILLSKMSRYTAFDEVFKSEIELIDISNVL